MYTDEEIYSAKSKIDESINEYLGRYITNGYSGEDGSVTELEAAILEAGQFQHIGFRHGIQFWMPSNLKVKEMINVADHRITIVSTVFPWNNSENQDVELRLDMHQLQVKNSWLVYGQRFFELFLSGFLKELI